MPSKEEKVGGKDTPRESGSGSAIVVYDSRYGNTEKIARSFAAGLSESGIETFCVNAKEAAPETLGGYGLIAVGAPTEWLTASKPMKEFLGKIEQTDLSGRYGFAFDTKLDRPLSGSASKLIEKELKNRGLDACSTRIGNGLP
jgi:flavodoxin